VGDLTPGAPAVCGLLSFQQNLSSPPAVSAAVGLACTSYARPFIHPSCWRAAAHVSGDLTAHSTAITYGTTERGTALPTDERQEESASGIRFAGLPAAVRTPAPVTPSFAPADPDRASLGADPRGLLRERTPPQSDKPSESGTPKATTIGNRSIYVDARKCR